MARMSGTSDDHARVGAKEKNAFKDGRTGAGSIQLPGIATGRKMPMASGGGINRAKTKSKLQ